MIRRGFSILFNLKLEATYYFGQDVFDELDMVPTDETRRTMEKYRLLHKVVDNGIIVLYENDGPGSVVPVYPIPLVETFTFFLRVSNPSFWMYADVRGWKKDSVFLLSNPSFISVANQVLIPASPLMNPISSFPMSFRYKVTLQTVTGLVEVRNSAGLLIRTHLVRPLDPSEPAGTSMEVAVDLTGFKEGVYQIRYVNSGGTTNENVFCSPNHTSDNLAVVQMNYQTGAWTGANPDQQYLIRIGHRQSNWFYDIHIRDNTTLGLLANDLAIQHLPAGEPPVVFNAIPASIPATNDYVRFQSAAQVNHWKRPFQFRLTNGAGTKTYVDVLPLPGPHEVQWDAVNLFTNIIVNI